MSSVTDASKTTLGFRADRDDAVDLPELRHPDPQAEDPEQQLALRARRVGFAAQAVAWPSLGTIFGEIVRDCARPRGGIAPVQPGEFADQPVPLGHALRRPPRRRAAR